MLTEVAQAENIDMAFLKTLFPGLEDDNGFTSSNENKPNHETRTTTARYCEIGDHSESALNQMGTHHVFHYLSFIQELVAQFSEAEFRGDNLRLSRSIIHQLTETTKRKPDGKKMHCPGWDYLGPGGQRLETEVCQNCPLQEKCALNFSKFQITLPATFFLHPLCLKK